MIKPVNKRILVQIQEEDAYKKSKSGLIIPNAGIMVGDGVQAAPKQTFVIVDIADDCTLKIKKGDTLMLTPSRYAYFLGDADEKLTLIREDAVEAVVSSEK